jgi:hypothetical protein
MLEKLLSVQVSEPTVRRRILISGALYEVRQTVHSQQSVQISLAASICEKQVVSVDGAYIPLVGGEWAEVRTVAIGEVKQEVTAQGERKVRTCDLSCFYSFVSFPPLPNRLHLLPVLFKLPPPCPVPLVLPLIILGNVPLLVLLSSLQKNDAHPFLSSCLVYGHSGRMLLYCS